MGRRDLMPPLRSGSEAREGARERKSFAGANDAALLPGPRNSRESRRNPTALRVASNRCLSEGKSSALPIATSGLYIRLLRMTISDYNRLHHYVASMLHRRRARAPRYDAEPRRVHRRELWARPSDTQGVPNGALGARDAALAPPPAMTMRQALSDAALLGDVLAGASPGRPGASCSSPR